MSKKGTQFFETVWNTIYRLPKKFGSRYYASDIRKKVSLAHNELQEQSISVQLDPQTTDTPPFQYNRTGITRCAVDLIFALFELLQAHGVRYNDLIISLSQKAAAYDSATIYSHRFNGGELRQIDENSLDLIIRYDLSAGRYYVWRKIDYYRADKDLDDMPCGSGETVPVAVHELLSTLYGGDNEQ